QCQLLIRSTRHCAVTDIGQQYYQHVKSIRHTIDEASTLIFNHQDQARGLLRVVAPTNFESSLKSEVVPRFLEQHPHVQLQLEFVKHPQDYLNQAFDLIILWKLTPLPFPDYALISKKLFTMPVGIYAAPSYLAQHGTPQTPEALSQHNCFSSIEHAWPFLREDGSLYHVSVSGNLLTQSDEIIYAATVAGLGIAYSYPFVFQQALQQQHVVRLLVPYTQLTVDVHLLYHPSHYVSQKITRFIDLVQSHYRAMQEQILQRGL
ncbi:MAG: hypothetical protein KDH94_05845, partial [Coxiellaceae bacterium]|nr:hypothetical protein [Coxiellaceae bacterium]